MDQTFESTYQQLEAQHWWFEGRRNMIAQLLKTVNKDAYILDVGCSGGALLQVLQEKEFKNIYGIDMSQKAVDVCLKKGFKNVYALKAEKTHFKDKEFDIVIASDVLEHIEDPKQALLEWYRILKSGGQLIVFVPAFQFLWSKHDEINHHFKRYSRSDLLNILGAMNFRIKRSSYWNFVLFFPISVVRLMEGKSFRNEKAKSGQLFKANAVMNNLLFTLLKCENQALQFLNFPWGVSVFAVAAK